MAMNAWLPRIEAGSDPKYQVIARAFAQAILNGQLPAGEKLPPHRSLASELHVTLCFASSIAAVFVKAMMPPLLAA